VILVIDNYDSFVYNLVHQIESLGYKTRVIRNDAIDIAGITQLAPDAIVISPGPCGPDQAGVGLEVVRTLAGQIPILGVCLGHQIIGAAFGGRVVRGSEPVHGKASRIFHDGKGIFKGLETPMDAARYHSLVVERNSLPDCLVVSAETDDGVIMGLRHTEYMVDGIQFHPESVLTVSGLKIIKNFLGGIDER
jgi:anthranilate synthase/aminodeoxychorismate synthase-like glutamine amidotransferase